MEATAVAAAASICVLVVTKINTEIALFHNIQITSHKNEENSSAWLSVGVWLGLFRFC